MASRPLGGMPGRQDGRRSIMPWTTRIPPDLPDEPPACDRCWHPIRDDLTILEMRDGPLRESRPTIRLCLLCLARLAEWLASGSRAALEGMDPLFSSFR